MLERRQYGFCMPLASGATSVLLLGCGGMGAVYFAQHPWLPRRELLKILSTDVSADDPYRRRLIAAIASALDYAFQHRDLIPNSCGSSGRAGPASDYTWGVSTIQSSSGDGP
jgi:serine/threonine protein kinase